MQCRCKKYPCHVIAEMFNYKNKLEALVLHADETHMDEIEQQSRNELECNLCKIQIILNEIKEKDTDGIYSNRETLMLCNLFMQTELAYYYKYAPTKKRDWLESFKKLFKRS